MLADQNQIILSTTNATGNLTGTAYRVATKGQAAVFGNVTFTGGSTDTQVELRVETSANGVRWHTAQVLLATDEEPVAGGSDNAVLLPFVRGRLLVTGTAPTAIDALLTVGFDEEAVFTSVA